MAVLRRYKRYEGNYVNDSSHLYVNAARMVGEMAVINGTATIEYNQVSYYLIRNSP